MPIEYIDKLLKQPTQTSVKATPPQTTVRLFSGVPLDNSYTHVRGILNQESINLFLSSYLVREVSEVSVINMGEAVINLPMSEYDALNCNYVSWYSSNFDTRWHYAFIAKTERLSNESCRIIFEKDVWNENQDRMVLKPSFIEQMIVPKSEDTVGRYTFHDGFELGEYEFTDVTTVPLPAERQRKIYALINFEESGDPAKGVKINGVYQGLRLLEFESVDAANSYISVQTEKNRQDGILNIFEMPENFVQENVSFAQVKNFSFSRAYGAIDGYTPKNRKMYCSPYMFLVLDNNQGSQVQIPFELFDSSTIKISYGIALNGGNPVLFCYPNNCAGLDNDWNHSVQFTGYPKCAFTTDFYKAWLAQNASGQQLRMGFAGLDAISGLISGGVSGATSGAMSGGTTGAIAGAVQGSGSAVFSGATSLLKEGLSIMNERKVAQLQPNATKNTSATGANAELNTAHISVRIAHIRAEYARRIDNFYSVFGYNIGEIRTPDVTSRPYWNYVKCLEASIGGVAELEDLTILKQIFKNGVTVWHTNDIGNYSLNNNG